MNNRISELDGLRGIAILLVISFHYINNQLINSQDIWGKFLAKITSFGWVGVDLFFVLSGFLITTILIKNKKSEKYFSTFYIRRIVRIVPTYFLLLFFFVIIISSPCFSANYFLSGNNIIPLWSYFTMTHNFYMGRLGNMGNSALSVSWSIGIEEQFYIIFPFIVYFLKEKYLPILLVLLIILASIFRAQFNGWIPTYVYLHCRMDSICFGALIAYLNIHRDMKRWVSLYSKWLITLFLIDVLVCAFLYIKYNDLGSIKHTLFALLFSIALIFALIDKKTLYGTILRNKILTQIGAMSYSLYLFHYIILGLFQDLIGNKTGIVIQNKMDFIVSIGALFFAFVLSMVTFNLIETPLVNYGKKYKY
jgi:peptidoglycan/LPS O-acetylase OafA/YrhL